MYNNPSEQNADSADIRLIMDASNASHSHSGLAAVQDRSCAKPRTSCTRQVRRVVRGDARVSSIDTVALRIISGILVIRSFTDVDRMTSITWTIDECCHRAVLKRLIKLIF